MGRRAFTRTRDRNRRDDSAGAGAFMSNYFTNLCSGSEAGSYLRLIDCVSLNSTQGLRVIKKRRRLHLRLLNGLGDRDRECGIVLL